MTEPTENVNNAPLPSLASLAEVENIFSPKQFVYTGRDNRFVVAFIYQGSDLNFSGATRFQLISASGVLLVDTDDNPGAIVPVVERDSTGKLVSALELNLGFLPGNRYRTPVTLVVYDAEHTNGQVVIHAEDDRLSIQYRAS